MGTSEDAKSVKTEKQSSPSSDQNCVSNSASIHVFPDWAAMQAYYGPRVAVPPYYNSAVASGHAPHPYMWGPPQMIPPYGTPYAAIYSHGGVYAHPAVSMGPQSHGPGGVPSSPAQAVTPLSIETPSKVSGSSSQGLMKKLKGFDGLAMSIGNVSTESAAGGVEHGPSESMETEGSSDGSDGTTAGANQTKRKRSREGTPITGKDAKIEPQASPVTAAEINESSSKLLGTTKAADATGKLGSVIPPGMSTALELRNPSSINAMTSPTSVPPCSVLPSEVWLQNEKEVKRERRKQSNRESARRSRLRKQAEAEELAHKVDSLTAENVAIRSEIKRLSENSEKIKKENATLMIKLKSAHAGRSEALDMNEKRMQQPVSTEIKGPVNKSIKEESNICKKNSSSGAKLCQLLDTSSRADAVAAS
ncbi:common plant regulatory factor 1-like isoform X1 [Cucurbita moschata]|uniref:Common plant regulatory factor 1-like isoform X1 n=1 Tax=Cucurbita moschata TaxID=3662 RepID=A0A6J1EDD2_CUCMO|nr:common plant regulatory factor 1-like isoform X1 [Cucurbita moschata]XP_022924748.1 common plant regulatory factor 1-like isoform X1 [Cucurbita moschata]